MMEPVFIYLLKASGIITLFYLVYFYTLKRETLFTFNRHFLLAGLVAGFTLPLIRIPQYIEVVIQPIATTFTTIPANNLLVHTTSSWTWGSLMFAIYLAITLALLIKFLWDLGIIFRLIYLGNKEKVDGFYHVKIDSVSAPFSFLNYIFYSPNSLGEAELENILQHEMAHGRQWHSLDVLFARLCSIILWFNPLIWWYSATVKQNLEYLADDRASMGVPSKKLYQYTLLRVSGATVCPVLTNPFYNSQIKKRIIMLHRSKSNQLRALKSALLLPAIAIFLYSFNTYEVYVPVETEVGNYTALDVGKIKIKIDKDTSDKELEEIKKDLAKKGIDFSYTVVHNNKGEIMELSMELASNKEDKSFKNSSNFENDGKPIDPITIVVDEGRSMVFMGEEKEMHEGSGHNVWVHSDDDKEHVEVKIEEKDGKKLIWINGEEASEEDLKKIKKKAKGENAIMMEEKMTVDIKEEDGRKVIRVNGKEVSEEEYKAMKKEKKHKMRIHKAKGEGHEEKIKVEVSEVDGKKVIKVNGKEVSEEEFDKMEMGAGKEKKVIKIKKMGDDQEGENVMIIKSGDEDAIHMEDIELIADDEDGYSFVFLNSEDEENMLFMVDGKESTAEAVKNIPSERIATVEIFKGEKAVKEFGEKAKNGVVKIKTKD